MVTRPLPQEPIPPSLKPGLESFTLKLWALCCLYVLLCETQAAQKPVVQEYEAKAILVLNFARLTSWPDNSFSNKEDTINILLDGNKDFFKFFQKYQGRKIKGRAINVLTSRPSSDSTTIHIRYFQGKFSSRIKQFLRGHNDKTKPILLVGENREFTEKGGTLSIVRDKERLILYSNTSAAKRSKLYLSNNLIKLTKKVSDQPLARR
jgi:hypothetical protein